MAESYRWQADVTVTLNFHDERDEKFVKEVREWWSCSSEEDEAWMEFVESTDNEVLDENVSDEQWEYDNIKLLEVANDG
jgi:hypothetical protein|tara:strand:- start:965 stop:1201 length:237 start_codon:yes stop_codon:yes gene_type:complete